MHQAGCGCFHPHAKFDTFTPLMEGLVTKSTGSWYQVKTPDGEWFDCRIKGKFRIKGITTTNPIAVGDNVDFDLEPEQGTGVITNLFPRKNYIIRKSVNLSRQAQIVAPWKAKQASR